MSALSEEGTMKRSTGPRTTAKLSKSVSHQLNSYALAASAAGVSVLALAPLAEAKVVYTPVHRVIQGGDPGIRYLDLNHDGITDFKFQNWSVYDSDIQLATLSVLPTPGNRIRGYGGSGIFSFRFPSALPAGTRIGPKGHFISGQSNDAMLRAPFGWGQRNNVKNRYLGFRFEIKGETHYGWARLNVSCSGPPRYHIAATLTGYAYETVPNRLIVAGKTKGRDVITIQPASLGHLARGANSIAAWRESSSSGGTQ
jgi:hypothetical protein